MIKRMYKKIAKIIRKSDRLITIASNVIWIFTFIDRSFRKELEFYEQAYRKETSTVKKKIKRDMIRCFVEGGFSPEEYFNFCFANKSIAERAEYVSIDELFRIYNSKDKNFLPKGKYNRYLYFKKYFLRDLICINFDDSEDEKERYALFCDKHIEMIVKPIAGKKGQGIKKLLSADVPSLSVLKQYIDGTCILEEVISQGEELKQLHPSSINTLRMVTGLNAEGKFTLLFSLLRIGQGDSIVDNVGSGGLVALVEHGKVVSDGLMGARYVERHPDTNIMFKGISIPLWHDLCQMAESAHRTLPQQRLVGWDFAWTTSGWDIVEVNPAPSFASWQSLSGKGIRGSLVEAGIF